MGEQLTGTITSTAPFSLTLQNADKSVTVTGKFVTESRQISYRCSGDAGYTDTVVLPGTNVTIKGTKTEIRIVNFGQLTNILLGGTENSEFSNKNDLIGHINSGEKFVGTINSNKVLILKSPTSTTTATGTFVTKPNQISYKCAGQVDYYINIPVNYGTTVIIQTQPYPSATINLPPYIIDLYLGSSTNNFINKKAVIDALNNGETFTGIVNKNGDLQLASTTTTTFTKCAIQNCLSNITYTCLMCDAAKASSIIISCDTFVTINGTQSNRTQITITVPKNKSLTLLSIAYTQSSQYTFHFNMSNDIFKNLNKKDITGTVGGDALVLTGINGKTITADKFEYDQPFYYFLYSFDNESILTEIVRPGTKLTITKES